MSVCFDFRCSDVNCGDDSFVYFERESRKIKFSVAEAAQLVNSRLAMLEECLKYQSSTLESLDKIKPENWSSQLTCEQNAIAQSSMISKQQPKSLTFAWANQRKTTPSGEQEQKKLKEHVRLKKLVTELLKFTSLDQIHTYCKGLQAHLKALETLQSPQKNKRNVVIPIKPEDWDVDRAFSLKLLIRNRGKECDLPSNLLERSIVPIHKTEFSLAGDNKQVKENTLNQIIELAKQQGNKKLLQDLLRLRRYLNKHQASGVQLEGFYHYSPVEGEWNDKMDHLHSFKISRPKKLKLAGSEALLAERESIVIPLRSMQPKKSTSGKELYFFKQGDKKNGQWFSYKRSSTFNEACICCGPGLDLDEAATANEVMYAAQHAHHGNIVSQPDYGSATWGATTAVALPLGAMGAVTGMRNIDGGLDTRRHLKKKLPKIKSYREKTKRVFEHAIDIVSEKIKETLETLALETLELEKLKLKLKLENLKLELKKLEERRNLCSANLDLIEQGYQRSLKNTGFNIAIPGINTAFNGVAVMALVGVIHPFALLGIGAYAFCHAVYFGRFQQWSRKDLVNNLSLKQLPKLFCRSKPAIISDAKVSGTNKIHQNRGSRSRFFASSIFNFSVLSSSGIALSLLFMGVTISTGGIGGGVLLGVLLAMYIYGILSVTGSNNIWAPKHVNVTNGDMGVNPLLLTPDSCLQALGQRRQMKQYLKAFGDEAELSSSRDARHKWYKRALNVAFSLPTLVEIYEFCIGRPLKGLKWALKAVLPPAVWRLMVRAMDNILIQYIQSALTVTKQAIQSIPVPIGMISTSYKHQANIRRVQNKHANQEQSLSLQQARWRTLKKMTQTDVGAKQSAPDDPRKLLEQSWQMLEELDMDHEILECGWQNGFFAKPNKSTTELSKSSVDSASSDVTDSDGSTQAVATHRSSSSYDSSSSSDSCSDDGCRDILCGSGRVDAESLSQFPGYLIEQKESPISVGRFSFERFLVNANEVQIRALNEAIDFYLYYVARKEIYKAQENRLRQFFELMARSDYHKAKVAEALSQLVAT